jgi:predicted RNase H-like nuclease (RuvC/YqgF family)
VIKTWQDRVEAAAHFREEDYINDVQYFMQAEIEELRTENARLKANIETRKSNYNRLKAMVDDRSISGRTFSLCEELEKENARLRVALEKAAMDIEAWGESSSKHRQDMWDLKADIDAARAALGES